MTKFLLNGKNQSSNKLKKRKNFLIESDSEVESHIAVTNLDDNLKELSVSNSSNKFLRRSNRKRVKKLV